jgi:hypothetical protein
VQVWDRHFQYIPDWSWNNYVEQFKQVYTVSPRPALNTLSTGQTWTTCET